VTAEKYCAPVYVVYQKFVNAILIRAKTFLYFLSESVFSEEFSLEALIPSPNANFGTSVSVSGMTLVVGAEFEGRNKGAVYVFTQSYTDGRWRQQQKLEASDREYERKHRFGCSVSIHGNTIAVGAKTHQSGTGAVYIFEKVDQTWLEMIPILLGEERNEFGASVALEGETVVVGASFGKKIYVFKRQGFYSWFLEGKPLVPIDVEGDDRYGHEVDISGNYIIASAHHHDSDGQSNSGAAYIFYNSQSGWVLDTKIALVDSRAHAEFGHSVAISGAIVVVGALKGRGTRQGAVYVYELKKTKWILSDTLEESVDSYDYYGYSVSISRNYLAVSAFGDDDLGQSAGAVYVYNKTSNTTFRHQMQVNSTYYL